ncbi:MAG TPA: dihydroneopterin triphosphate diphosphatase [Burkholderiaceae bacterium]|nr:dihydroneopterin triphosphate diphosphatase [Burkholderiaceae bacterium]
MQHRKIPESVLVIVYTLALDVLIIERADHPGFWQSVTGSKATLDEPLPTVCVREVAEETGLRVPVEHLVDWKITHRFAIYEQWRHRYAEGVTHNTEHVFGLCVPQRFEPQLNPLEHTRYQWLPWRAAADACFSWTNAEAIRRLQSLESSRGA